ncbi:FMN-linked oxidoreductase [Hanseniaspora valbyensis NRRL Y-1626]|uniref:tRNA-dihydrouridine(47) synthase [NAD(P)(+)] n=1 Tax=Hanseniaspora valbyensis NRRL Y-1626 TaxID=766949 RepID=A0A1B7T8S3_9ASCO|nr:FMN-linked oxidoreductase [Hanseniaspora valbyensis NRRL Y-1626]
MSTEDVTSHAELKRSINEISENGVDEQPKKQQKVSPPSHDGIAYIKAEFLKPVENGRDSLANDFMNNADDDEGSSERLADGCVGGGNQKGKKRGKKNKGQNKDREVSNFKEACQLCPKYKFGAITESEGPCPFVESCKFCHDVDKYISLKLPEIESKFFDKCPIYETSGFCPMGVKCKFLKSHWDSDLKKLSFNPDEAVKNYDRGVINLLSYESKQLLSRKNNYPFEDSNKMIEIQEAFQQDYLEKHRSKQGTEDEKKLDAKLKDKRDHLKEIFQREKKNLDYRRKYILAPLTTVGNLPYRRLMKKLGCDITYSEMALCKPLMESHPSEWALAQAHKSEVPGFAFQIAGNQPWLVSKTCEAINKLLGTNEQKHFTEINLNIGCPIPLVFNSGAGSSLMDAPSKLIRMLNAMSYCAGDIPVTAKIRMGVKTDVPTANQLVKRLVNETDVQAITLHGRSREQRYTKLADWKYIQECAVEAKKVEAEYKSEMDGKIEDGTARSYNLQFIGNGDLYDARDWHKYLGECPELDSISIGRGCLIKPWIFEEIEHGDNIDKSSSERLDILADYARFSMEHFGTDERGILQARRFFCEFMSFFHRYIPIGILEKQNKLNERPSSFFGRNDLETLLSSPDSEDWIKVSEMFFVFQIS